MNTSVGSFGTVEYWKARLRNHRNYLKNPKDATAKAWAELSLAICLQKLRSLRSNLEQDYANKEKYEYHKVLSIQVHRKNLCIHGE